MTRRVGMPEAFDTEVSEVQVLDASQFDDHHRGQILAMTYHDGLLRFADPRWRCRRLGSGEEKATFLVRDQLRRVFALEVIDERTYLDGRFVTGEYFGTFRAPGVSGRSMDPDALIGLRFTGLVKARQYAPGYEWARFQWRPDRHSCLDALLTTVLQARYAAQFERYRSRYRDVHERNVVFELRPLSRRGVPLVIRDWRGRHVMVRVGLQPVDLR